MNLKLNIPSGVDYEAHLIPAVYGMGETTASGLAEILGEHSSITCKGSAWRKTGQEKDARSHFPYIKVSSEVRVLQGVRAGVLIEIAWFKGEPNQVTATVMPLTRLDLIANRIFYGCGAAGALIGVAASIGGLFSASGPNSENASVIGIGLLFVVGLIVGAIISRLVKLIGGSKQAQKENEALATQVEAWLKSKFPAADGP